MTLAFVHSAPAQRIVFRPGAVDAVPEECERLGLGRVLVIGGDATQALAERVVAALGGRVVGLFTDVVQHVPTEQARAVVDRTRSTGADGVVTVGGGSTTGLGKVVALECGLPVVAVPTTYAGSEMTPIYGITDGDRKQTGQDGRVIPTTVLYDPALTVTMPPGFTASSGMNALAHSVEALWLETTTPISAAYAERSIRLLVDGLRGSLADPADLGARSAALMGACLAGRALGLSGTGLHHKICHVLGGRFRLGHSEVHSAVLPHVVAWNSEAAPSAVVDLGWALRSDDPAGTLFDLVRELGAPTALASLGLTESQLPETADLVVAGAPANPRPLERDGVLRLLEAALAGARPKAG
jgi:maleylacetate reductase